MANGLNHWATSRRLIIQADAELAAGDQIQASEKGWGAAAHAVKAVAQERGWRHDNHARLFGIANRLAAETGDSRIRRFSMQPARRIKISTKEICPKKTLRTAWRRSERFWTS